MSLKVGKSSTATKRVQNILGDERKLIYGTVLVPYSTGAIGKCRKVHLQMIVAVGCSTAR